MTGTIRLSDIWFALLRQKLLVLAVTSVFLAFSILAAFLMTPIYRAEVLMAYVDNNEGSGLASLASQYANVAALAGVSLGRGGSQKEEAIATLLSRSFTLKFIESKNIKPYLFPKIGNSVESSDSDLPTSGEAYRKFDTEIRSVAEDRKSGLITLSIDFSDRYIAADWANSIVALVNSTLRQRAIDDSNRSIEFLMLELEKTGPEELRQSIYELIKGHIGSIMLANVHEQYAFKIIDPAVVPDEDAFEKPKRLLIIASGGIAGFLVSLSLVFFGISTRKESSGN
jgi:uncharacterized protein involved in exopolysaccharide biosynthesis